MTEHQWLGSSEPVRMLTYLRFGRGVTRSKAGRCKLLLFGCACCRRVARLFPDERGWPVVDLAERLVDGDANQVDLDAAVRDGWPAPRDGEEDPDRQARLSLYEAFVRL